MICAAPALADEHELNEVRHEAYREAAERSMRVINSMMATIGGRLLAGGTIKDVLVDFWTVAYATDSYLCQGMSVTAKAQEIGVEKATLSKNIIEFVSGNGLPAPSGMRDPKTMMTYREARLRSIESENARYK